LKLEMKTLRNLWIDLPSIDLAVALIVGVAMAMCADWLATVIGGSHSTLITLFQGLAAIAVTLAGFTLTSIAFLVGQLKVQLDKLDASWKPGVNKEISSLMFKPLRLLVLTFLGSIAVVVLSSDDGLGRQIVIGVAVGCAAGALSALGRNVWLIYKLSQQ
jgi:hypothetical protein